MIDIASQLKAIHRQVEQQLPADGSGEVVSVLLRRADRRRLGRRDRQGRGASPAV
jgi:hypothetical protein